VPRFPKVRRPLQQKWLSTALLLCALPTLAQTPNQTAPQPTASASDAAIQEQIGRVILVLPFDNRSGQTNLAWIGESFPDTLNQRLNSSGFLTISRDDRQYALDHLGLPEDFRPTRATTIRIAQTLDANFVIVGSYTVSDNRIKVQAQILDVNKLRLSPPIEDSAELPRLFDVQNAVAWKIARQIDPHFNVAQQTFLAASSGIRLSAFENYIRGTDATTPQERISRLQMAVLDTPNYPAALLALGKAQYAERDYDHAAITLAKVPRTDRRALEANFYLGLAFFNSAKYADAESAFAFVASRLPLPEVVNDQGVASSRQGHDATPLFQRASTADPNDADYHFNVAVSLHRRGDLAGALHEVDLALKLKPTDAEAISLKSHITAEHPGAAKTGSNSDFSPLERIRRTYSEASFRQAAFQLDQMRAMRLATLPRAEQATQYVQQGRDYLAQGLIPEAEQEFQSAIAADPNNSSAHTGLAQVREQSGSDAEARTEAQASLKLQPTAAAWLVLAHIDFKGNNLAASASDVNNALHLEPNNTAAQGMRQALQARGQSLP
jgi:tetratricopeptide (TPR) repeat protein